MKNLTPEVSGWIDGDGAIHPRFLIEIELDEVLRLSTAGDIEDDSGQVWTGGLVQGLVISQDKATFGLANEGFKYTTPALKGIYQRAPVKIWLYGTRHTTPTTGRGEPVLRFEGNVSRFTQITTVLGIEATRSAARRYPTLRVLPPIANFLRAEGTAVALGGEVFYFGATERMTEYPSIGISVEGYSPEFDDGTEVIRSDGGRPWIYRHYDEEQVTFDITHPSMTKEQEQALRDFYAAHKHEQVLYRDPRYPDKEFHVWMTHPPVLDGMTGGRYANIRMTLMGKEDV